MNTRTNPQSTAHLVEPFSTAEDIALIINTTPQTVNKWRIDDIIPAEVDEGSLVRYDLQKVLNALMERAAAKRQMRLESRAKNQG